MVRRSQVEVTTSSIRLWNVGTGALLRTLIGHTDGDWFNERLF